MDEHNQNRDSRHYGMNRNRGNRYGRSNRPGHGGPGRSRSQRPLLTSAINGAGLCLIALVLVNKETQAAVHCLLSTAVILFSFSSLISYIAQRVGANWVEKISDLFFIGGAALMIWVAASLGGYIA